MQLHIFNNHTHRLWVAIMFFSPDTCRDHGSWGTRGWWAIDPGGAAHVLNTNNPFAYFYAEAANGSIWRGPFGPVHVTNTPFDSCINIGSTNSRLVGMKEIHIDAPVLVQPIGCAGSAGPCS